MCIVGGSAGLASLVTESQFWTTFRVASSRESISSRAGLPVVTEVGQHVAVPSFQRDRLPVTWLAC